ncbi:hypothetical protein IAU60_006902 [Kwoniella sp. DSM 27419]
MDSLTKDDGVAIEENPMKVYGILKDESPDSGSGPIKIEAWNRRLTDKRQQGQVRAKDTVDHVHNKLLDRTTSDEWSMIELGAMARRMQEVLDTQKSYDYGYAQDLEPKKGRNGKGYMGPYDSNLSPIPSRPGINMPFFYLALPMSLFPWHVEDFWLNSLSVLYSGSPKVWQVLSADQAEMFERLVDERLQWDRNQCEDHLKHKQTFILPHDLARASNYNLVPSTIIQRAGDMVITFPRAYHSGFNADVNLAEAKNFGYPDWAVVAEGARVCRCGVLRGGSREHLQTLTAVVPSIDHPELQVLAPDWTLEPFFGEF